LSPDSSYQTMTNNDRSSRSPDHTGPIPDGRSKRSQVLLLRSHGPGSYEQTTHKNALLRYKQPVRDSYRRYCTKSAVPAEIPDAHATGTREPESHGQSLSSAQSPEQHCREPCQPAHSPGNRVQTG